MMQQVQTEGPSVARRGLMGGRGRGERNEAHVHITVSTDLTAFVGFSVRVEVEGVEMVMEDSKCVKMKDG